MNEYLDEYIVYLADPGSTEDSLAVIIWARSEELAMWTAMTRHPDKIAISATWTGESIKV